MDGWLNERQRDGGIDLVPLPADVSGELRLCGKRAIATSRFADPTMPWDTVVCLCRRHELADRYPDYVAWMDEAPRSDRPDRSVWWPIHDLGAEPVDRTMPFVDDLVARLRGGSSLLVHCAAGIGRAGTTAVAVLIRLGVPIDEALDTVRTARPLAGPEAGAQRRLVHEIALRTGR